MRAFLHGLSGFAGVVLIAALSACASDVEDVPVAGNDVGSTEPAPKAPTGETPKKEETPAAPAEPKNECKVAGMTGVANVEPSFVIYNLPNEIPAPTKGGTLSGQYAVDGAKVYLPSGTGGLVDPKASTGSINSWAVFDGANYRLHLKGDFTVASVQGPLSQGVDNESQGGFTIDSDAVLFDYACDTETPEAAEYSFTDDGSGRATIVIKMNSPYGTTYLQLDATKM